MWVEDLLCLASACINGMWAHPHARRGLGWYSTGKLVQGESSRWLMAACFPSIDCINARN